MPISPRILHTYLILMIMMHQCFFDIVGAVGSIESPHSEQELIMLANLAKDTQSSLIEMQNERLNSILRLHGEYQKNNVEINTLASNASIIDNIQSQSFIETTPLLRDSHPLVTGKKSNRITVTSKRKKEHKVAGTKGSIAVQFDTGTNIRAAKGTLIDPSQIGVFQTSGSIQNKARLYYQNQQKKNNTNKIRTTNNPDVFEFGIPGTHLIFSKPVAITLKTPNYSDGIMVDIAALHAEDSGFNTGGISVDPSTTCREDGSTSKPGSNSIVRGGQIIFYTCGASSFTVNPVGGVAYSGDIGLIIGDYGQVQTYYNGSPQIVGGNPPSSGSGGPSVWPILRVGTTNIGNTYTPWTSASTSGSQVGNTYTAITRLSYRDPATSLNYTLDINWSYTSPNKYLTWSYNLTVPTGNTKNIKFYFGMDTSIAGTNTSDVGYSTNTPTQTIGVYDAVANILSTQRYISGKIWSGHIVSDPTTIRSQISLGGNFSNSVVTSSGNLANALNWDFGTIPGTHTSTTEWRISPYVSQNVPDLIPGIGQPEPGLSVGQSSTLPLMISNAGNATSSGTHTAVITLGSGINGPTSTTVSNGWNCSATIASTVTCTKNTTISPMSSESFALPIVGTNLIVGSTKRITMDISGGNDSNNGNNNASIILQYVVASDTTLPSLNTNYTSGALLPIGKFTYKSTYSDTGGINTGSLNQKIYKWNSTTLTWGTTDMSPTYSSGWTSVTTTGALLQVTGLPYGKYRFDTSIADIYGNRATRSIILYIDSISWSLSSPELNIGNIAPNTMTYGTGELIITVRTVGAGYTIKTISTPRGTMSAQNRDLATRENLSSWNGSLGYGVSLWSGTAYSSTLYSMSNLTIANQSASINTNGDLNTYTYRIRGGALVDISQGAGDYLTSLGFQLVVNY